MYFFTPDDDEPHAEYAGTSSCSVTQGLGFEVKGLGFRV